MYDYSAGKDDWQAAGLPTEGTNGERPRAADVARKDVPTCGLQETLGDVRARASGWNVCVVVNEQRVVMGLLRAKELDADHDRLIQEVMRPGPSTFRPHVSITEMATYMTEHKLESSPITTSDGKLIGILLRDDAVAAADQLRDQDSR
ncbi:MAG TPA: CBS domain-containing protein [Actinomycetota bacterium]|nr:CBS domain-containing protein [Actinomycetota bacterium]